MKTKFILLSLSLFLASMQFFGQGINSKASTSFKTSVSAKGNRLLNEGSKEQSTLSDLKSAEEIKEALRLKLSCDANSYYDEALVIFNNSDPSQGAAKFMSMYASAPELWSVKNGQKYSISFLGGLDSTISVPITVKAGVSAKYTLTASQVESFGTNIEVSLEDRVSGSIVNLGITPIYSFQVSVQGTMADRFYLHFKDVTSDPNKFITAVSEKDVARNFNIYAADGSIRISSLQQLRGKIAVFDLLGHKIATGNIDAGAMNQIDMQGKTGVYIVNVLSSKGSFNTKILVK